MGKVNHHLLYLVAIWYASSKFPFILSSIWKVGEGTFKISIGVCYFIYICNS